jgi:Tfp pilus assembly protein PilV
MLSQRHLKLRRQSGVTIIETAIATAVLLIGIVGVMGMFAVAAAHNANQGEVATRCVEYAQDKMEQLLALDFTNTTANTTTYPTAFSGGVGLSTGGGVTIGSAVTNYVDYFDASGTPLGATSTNSFYTRQWQISVDGTGKLKTITVVASAKVAVGGKFTTPSATLVCYKVNLQ